ncbi:MAG: hypothetical protein PHV78_03260 [Patescibacteria group bacterium]|nr:hypothetical protein [Patescibacteria group bacterium]MDD5121595.1 hypothetical protein [Patescibacteria group bacterium]MDD5222228.1 hypothetical protein [Patescibacteria group bacterium]MDD5396241.1 hypothetical protein [Patescibacteria group bacterium]
MKIFIAHSSNYDFKKELYEPLRDSSLDKEHKIILPQGKGFETITRDVINGCDLLVAEISYPSTGLGIELGWADVAKIPAIGVYKEGTRPSPAVNKMIKDFIIYNDADDMINKLREYISNLKK